MSYVTREYVTCNTLYITQRIPRTTTQYNTIQHVMFCDVTSRHVTSRHVTSRYLTSCHVTSRHVTPRKSHRNRAIVPMYTMHHNTTPNNNNTNHTPHKQQNTHNATIQCRNVQYNITQY